MAHPVHIFPLPFHINTHCSIFLDIANLCLLPHINKHDSIFSNTWHSPNLQYLTRSRAYKTIDFLKLQLSYYCAIKKKIASFFCLTLKF